MLQETIDKRQNSAEMLKCQFAARHYYNTAENFSTAAFICSIVSLLFIFAPEGTSSLLLHSFETISMKKFLESKPPHIPTVLSVKSNP